MKNVHMQALNTKNFLSALNTQDIQPPSFQFQNEKADLENNSDKFLYISLYLIAIGLSAIYVYYIIEVIDDMMVVISGQYY